MRKRIYVAGPMSGGDRIHNLAQALAAMRDLMLAGYAPFCPQLSFFADPFIGADHATWLAVDLPWVGAADAVLRLPGASKGADMETAEAARRGIPVFGTIEILRRELPA